MNFDTMLKKAISFHGHTCAGLVLGTRIAIAGSQRLGIDDPSKTRDLIVYVEIDRCLADAIQAITLCSLGKRRLKHVDYGKFAATFVDTSKNRAVRISVKEEACEWAMKYGEKHGLMKKGEIINRKQEMYIMTEAYTKIPEVDLLDIKNVSLSIPKWDLPGLPEEKVICTMCGERIFDGREKIKNGRIVCRPCAEGAYYRNLNETKLE
jgi:formylmethanofuran dehydrogenase subunit E